MTDAEFERFVHECWDELQQKQEEVSVLLLFTHRVGFDEGRIAYDLDGSPAAEAAIVPIGSRGLKSGTWLWAWNNPPVADRFGAALEPLREFARTVGRTEFAAQATIPADERQAWSYAAVACQFLVGVGVARITANDSDWFLVLRDLTRHFTDAEVLPAAERAARESLLAARGAGLLNVMRKRFPSLRVSLIDADLRGAPNPWAYDLHTQILKETDDSIRAGLQAIAPDQPAGPGLYASHQGHDLTGANLTGARLDGAVLRGVTLLRAQLDGASLVDADLSRADLRGASLRKAFLNGTNLTGANLAGADFAGAELSRTLLTAVDLSQVRGLAETHHMGPSEIGMSTLVASSFDIDVAFLRNAGVSRGLIQDLRRGKRFAGSYQTVFLSYSSQDREFAMQLYTALTGAGVRVFWDYFDLVPGEELERQIAEAIREMRRLIVVLSAASLKSEWVEREIRLAWIRRRESLLPIRLCPIEDVKLWTAVDSKRPDLANTFPIQDFSGWKTPATFAHALSMLLQGLGGPAPAALSPQP
jgi:uncharacterized protein YjbI with pentapeptide repeats